MSVPVNCNFARLFEQNVLRGRHNLFFYIGSLILERDHLNRVCCRVIVFIEQWNTRSNGAADDRPLGRDWNSGKIRRPFQNSEP